MKFSFPDGYNYYISEFTSVERSKIVGKAKFKTIFRVDIANEDIEGFVDKIGQKVVGMLLVLVKKVGW